MPVSVSTVRIISTFHDDRAAERFPGPEYREVLGWIHEALRPRTYVEIGVLGGGSLHLARPETLAIGIDPNSHGPGVFSCTSNHFFAHFGFILREHPVHLAFIDGLHLFEQALSDFENLERYAAPGAIIALHDTIPFDRETSGRRRTTDFYTGDVWKTVALLRRERPALDMVTVATAPSGLTLVRIGSGRRSAASHIPEFLALDWEVYERHHAGFLHLIPNERTAVVSFCQKTPVQSISSMGAEMPSRER